MSESKRFATLCVAVLLASMLAGCGGSKEGAASQVAVKVNKGEISVHQLNSMLARAGNIPQDQVKNVTAIALDRLVDQEVLVQKALAQKLDRDPRVLQMVEFAKREILARAYSEQVADKAQRPTEEQINAFYDENPSLFAKRRVYDLQEVNIRVPADKSDVVRERLREGGSLQQITSWLSGQNLLYTVNAATNKPAEQVPAEIHKMEPGQAVAVTVQGGLALISVAAARDESVDRAKARPVIENMLLGRARGELVRNELKSLRDTATIQYVGDFGPPVKEERAAAAAASEPEPEAKPEAEPATEAASDADAIRSAIQEGAAKLK
ncbi:MAG: EpsD family peptidyl-prolyl cis-trans isomerase [Azoarcus sp.]|jgi:EpsD family peptidyl-prolyl cis-trans isomerase|nr:EpsD family peptidyl-prolyl cis-trans isomerase [Azoarcus sp.]